MKILAFEDKHTTLYFDASTKELKLDAFMAAFWFRKNVAGWYSDMANDENIDHREAYQAACTGDRAAAKLFLQYREDYEYEGFDEIDTITQAEVEIWKQAKSDWWRKY